MLKQSSPAVELKQLSIEKTGKGKKQQVDYKKDAGQKICGNQSSKIRALYLLERNLDSTHKPGRDGNDCPQSSNMLRLR